MEFEFSKIDEFFVDIIVSLKLFLFEMIMIEMIIRWVNNNRRTYWISSHSPAIIISSSNIYFVFIEALDTNSVELNKTLLASHPSFLVRVNSQRSWLGFPSCGRGEEEKKGEKQRREREKGCKNTRETHVEQTIQLYRMRRFSGWHACRA